MTLFNSAYLLHISDKCCLKIFREIKRRQTLKKNQPFILSKKSFKLLLMLFIFFVMLRMCQIPRQQITLFVKIYIYIDKKAIYCREMLIMESSVEYETIETGSTIISIDKISYYVSNGGWIHGKSCGGGFFVLWHFTSYIIQTFDFLYSKFIFLGLDLDFSKVFYFFIFKNRSLRLIYEHVIVNCGFRI